MRSPGRRREDNRRRGRERLRNLTAWRSAERIGSLVRRCRRWQMIGKYKKYFIYSYFELTPFMRRLGGPRSRFL